MSTPYEARLMPSGCATLVISLAEPFSQVQRLGVPGGGSGRIGSLVVGLEDRPAICVHPGGQEAIRVEFTPLGAYRLFGMPMSELTNLAVEIRDVLGPEATTLVERLAATPDWAARFDLLDAALLDRLWSGPEPAPEVDHAWQLLSGSAGAIPIARIAAEVGWSQGYLIRRFTQQIGLAPKASARVLRFRHAVAMLGGGAASLAEITTACGFYDQAHLNREFRAIADTTPGQMVAARRVEGALALSASTNSSKTGPTTGRYRPACTTDGRSDGAGVRPTGRAADNAPVGPVPVRRVPGSQPGGRLQGLTLLHRDRDFERISAVTGQAFQW